MSGYSVNYSELRNRGKNDTAPAPELFTNIAPATELFMSMAPAPELFMNMAPAPELSFFMVPAPAPASVRFHKLMF